MGEADRSGQEGKECSRRPLVNGFVGNVSNIIHNFISLYSHAYTMVDIL